MKEKIINLAHSGGISQIGIVNAEVFFDLGSVLEKHNVAPMTEPNINIRINPFLLMTDARAIIVCLFPYYANSEKANISKYARGEDYHSVIAKRLSQIKDFLESNAYKAEIYADNSPLNDRYLAYKAGLGFIGRNGFLINPLYGTYTFIGYIITDCPLEPDTPSAQSCANCMRCVQNCPGHALSQNGQSDFTKCLSYITQKKGDLTADEKRIVKQNGSAWGCDVCQDVCPHNINAKKTDFPEFAQNLICTLDIDEHISNKEFKRRYSDRAFAWRGKNVILRNLKVLENDD